MDPRSAGATGREPTRRQLFRLFLNEREDPRPFYEHLARRAVADLPFPVEGHRVVDLGCGPGHYTRELRRAGAIVLPIDVDTAEFSLPGGPPGGQVVADARLLPVANGQLDGAFCSNMLEHTRGTADVFNELARAVRSGGWVWMSWTNWLSPWGGHEMSPLHYLGPRLGLRLHRRLRGELTRNVPGEGLFPVHIGQTLELVRRDERLRLVDARPRYYPSQRWILRVPGLREVVTWNCVLLIERR